MPKGSIDSVKVLSGIVVDAYACTKAILKVFEDCRCRRFAICISEAVPHCIGCGAFDQQLLNHCIAPQDYVAHDHTIFLIKYSLLGIYSASKNLSNVLNMFIVL